MIDLEKLERLHAEATPGPWHTEYTKIGDGLYGQLIFDSKGETIAQLAWHKKPEKNGVIGTDRGENAAYIVDACNAVPELIAENRKLRECIRIDSGRAWKLAYFIAERAVCADCPAKDDCSRDGGMFISDCIEMIFKWTDKQATKETGE